MNPSEQFTCVPGRVDAHGPSGVTGSDHASGRVTRSDTRWRIGPTVGIATA